MRIWHAELIPHLCQKHLCAMWREGLGAYKIITENKQGYRNHPATKEFANSPLALYQVLEQVRTQMLARNYHPKDLPPKPITTDNSAPKPWQSLAEQVNHLKTKQCKCQLNNLNIIL